MSGFLTTHVLDTSSGRPAKGIRIDLFRIDRDTRMHLISMITNTDGRTDERILPPETFRTGAYELEFHVGDYLESNGHLSGQTRFLDVIPIRFIMSEHSHYHIPLLLSPFGYSTYRGS